MVKGTFARPAASMVATRRAGSLERVPWWGIPGSMSRGEMFSNIIPIDGLVGRSSLMSSSSRRPGLAWGKMDVSVRTSADISAT